MNVLSISRLAVASFLVLLTACAGTGGSKLTYETIETRYQSGLVGWASESGQLNTVILGNPFATKVDPEAIAQVLKLPRWFKTEAIAQVSKLPRWFKPVQLTTRPKDPARTENRLVLVFNPTSRPLGGKAACGDLGRIAVAGPSATMRVQLAFCSGSNLNTAVILDAPVSSGPGDPTFQRHMNEALAVLLPSENPLHRSGGRKRRR